MKEITLEHYRIIQMLIKRKFPDVKLMHVMHFIDENSRCLLCKQHVSYMATAAHLIKHVEQSQLLTFI